VLTKSAFQIRELLEGAKPLLGSFCTAASRLPIENEKWAHTTFFEMPKQAKRSFENLGTALLFVLCLPLFMVILLMVRAALFIRYGLGLDASIERPLPLQ
jgi:hypothetical protein